jgi:hypothetical protein
MKTTTMIACAALAAAGASAQPVAEWTTQYRVITMGSSRLADVDGDGVKDIVHGTMGPIGSPYNEGRVYAVDISGTPLPGFPVYISRPITSPIAVADIDNDGDMELIAEAWYELHVWNHDGTAYPGWPVSTGTSWNTAPTVADLDGDGDMEIIAALGASMGVWHHDATVFPGWPRAVSENLNAPAVGDIDGDGEPEIIAGESRPQFPDTVPFSLHAWNADGSAVAGFPVGNLNSIRGPVALGDLDNDGDIDIACRCGDYVYAWDNAGAALPGWPVATGDPTRNSATSIGDLDGDGDLEVVIGGYEVHAFEHDGSYVAGFPVSAPTTGNINSSPILADIDADPTTLEILVKVIDGVFGVDNAGNTLPGYPYFLDDENNTGTYSPSPAVGDADGDGDLEMVFTSITANIAFFDEVEAWTDGLAAWPQAQHDAQNTCLLAGADCPPDFNGDGVVNSQDFVAFLNAFVAGDLSADFNGDGVINSQDFVAFLNAFVAGC